MVFPALNAPEAGWVVSALGGLAAVAESGAPICGSALGLAAGELGVTLALLVASGLVTCAGWSPLARVFKKRGTCDRGHDKNRHDNQVPPASCRARDSLWSRWGAGRRGRAQAEGASSPWEAPALGPSPWADCRWRWNPPGVETVPPTLTGCVGVGGAGANCDAIMPVAEAGKAGRVEEHQRMLPRGAPEACTGVALSAGVMLPKAAANASAV